MTLHVERFAPLPAKSLAAVVGAIVISAQWVNSSSVLERETAPASQPIDEEGTGDRKGEVEGGL